MHIIYQQDTGLDPAEFPPGFHDFWTLHQSSLVCVIMYVGQTAGKGEELQGERGKEGPAVNGECGDPSNSGPGRGLL